MRGALALASLAMGLGLAAGLLGVWALALILPIGAIAFVVWPAAGVAVLLLACALDRFAVGVGGPNVRLDELAALALAGALAVRAAMARRALAPSILPGIAGSAGVAALPRDGQLSPRGASLPHVPLLIPLLAYFGSELLSTGVSTDDLTRGLSLDIITLVLVVLYSTLVIYLSTQSRLTAAVRVWLAIASAEAVVGLLAFTLYHVTHSAVPGVQLEPVTGAPMVYGTLYEANIFGSYMSAAFLIALALATEETVRRKSPLYIVCALTAVGLLLSATRSAWGATVAGAVLLLVLARFGRGDRRARRAVRLAGGLTAVGLVVGVGLAVAPPSVTGSLGTRFQGLLNFGSGSGYGRLLLYRVALDEWSTHPILGLGPGSYSYRLPGDTSSGPAWLPNLALQQLHDTGIVGLLAMLWLFGAFYMMTLRAMRRAPPGPPRAMLAGLIAAVTAVLIAFQLTPGFTLGYSWALLALAVAAAGVVARGQLDRREPAEALAA